MNERIKKLWVAALRSGKYRQGQNQLRKGRGANTAYCCLGVLEDLAVKQGVIKSFRGTDGLLHTPVMKWAGLDDDDPMLAPLHDVNCYAADMNDRGKSFSYIADRIEKYL